MAATAGLEDENVHVPADDDVGGVKRNGISPNDFSMFAHVDNEGVAGSTENLIVTGADGP